MLQRSDGAMHDALAENRMFRKLGFDRFDERLALARCDRRRRRRDHGAYVGGDAERHVDDPRGRMAIFSRSVA
jgi:hypothetical protein